MPGAPVNILTDITMALPMYSPHNYAPLPPPVPPPTPAVPMSPGPASALEPPLPQLWPPGNATFANKYALTVLHKGVGIVQTGHDLGIMIPHVQAIPAVNNLFTSIHTLFSSRKVMFSSTSVKADGQFVALAGLIGLPPTPMMICGEPLSFPMGEVPTRWTNTVHVGFSWSDVLLGTLLIALQMAGERWMMPKGKYGPLKQVVKDSRAGRGALIYQKMFPVQSLKDVAGTVKTQVVAAASGVLTAKVQGEGSITLSLGSPYAQVSVAVSKDAEGNYGSSVATQVPTLSMSGGAQQGKGVTMQTNANWGTGGASHQRDASESKVVTHDALRGETTP
jgi:hypothetical protein